MNLSERSNQPMPISPTEDQAIDPLPLDSLPSRWSSRVFYLFSAALHIVAVIALSGSWIWHSSANRAQAETLVESPIKPPVARMAIDVGPIKFCEMKIESLIGRPQSQQER